MTIPGSVLRVTPDHVGGIIDNAWDFNQIHVRQVLHFLYYLHDLKKKSCFVFSGEGGLGYNQLCSEFTPSSMLRNYFLTRLLGLKMRKAFLISASQSQ